jgi:hypothetical protein
MSAPSRLRLDTEAALKPEIRTAFNQLMDDYNIAAKEHVPGWKGGASPKIIAALIEAGWRKVSV